jgi:hypothetical protein
MTAINFPDSPSNGDTHVVGGVTYTYDSTETKWKTTINSNAFLPLTGGTLSGNLTTTGDVVLGGELQHNGDTDTKLHFDTDTIKLDTAGSERFRVGSAGQLGIGGATYGTSGQVLTSQGSGSAPQWATVSASNLTRGTRQPSTSGTAIDFTGIPPEARIITVCFQNVSKNGGDQMFVQLGTSSGPTTTGYDSGGAFTGSGSGLYERTDGFVFGGEAGSTYDVSGVMRIYNIDNNIWVASHAAYNGQYYCSFGGGEVALSGTCDRVRIRFAGSNSFDAGNLNIFYEV